MGTIWEEKGNQWEAGEKGTRESDGVIMIKVHYMHGGKCHNEILYLVRRKT
jgi:hypothetical protein